MASKTGLLIDSTNLWAGITCLLSLSPSILRTTNWYRCSNCCWKQTWFSVWWLVSLFASCPQRKTWFLIVALKRSFFFPQLCKALQISVWMSGNSRQRQLTWNEHLLTDLEVILINKEPCVAKIPWRFSYIALCHVNFMSSRRKFERWLVILLTELPPENYSRLPPLFGLVTQRALSWSKERCVMWPNNGYVGDLSMTIINFMLWALSSTGWLLQNLTESELSYV